MWIYPNGRIIGYESDDNVPLATFISIVVTLAVSFWISATSLILGFWYDLFSKLSQEIKERLELLDRFGGVKYDQIAMVCN